MVAIFVVVTTLLTLTRDTSMMLWGMIKDQVGYITNYAGINEDFHSVASNLLARVEDTKISVEAAENRDEDIRCEVRDWQKKAKEIKIEIRELEDEMKNVDGLRCCCDGCCPNPSSRYRLGKRAAKTRDKIEKLLQTKTFEVVSHPPQSFNNSIAISAPPDFQLFESTKVAKEKVIEALGDDEVNVIGVYGMGGVGKTYLVKKVQKEALRMGLFDRVVMAVVSQTPSVSKVQGQIAEKLGLRFRGESESARAEELREKILRCQNLLVIVDDIWALLKLSEVGIPHHGKCKILLTTRRQNVCHVMGCQEEIHLENLSEDDSLALLQTASGNYVDSPQFISVVRAVASECRGLPVALVTVGRALGRKDLRVWRNAARRLRHSEVADPDDDGTVFKCIKLSYDYLTENFDILTGETVKWCFLICCLFPEDHIIHEEELTRYAMGLGLFPRVQTLEQARDEAHAMVEHLKNSCLLLGGDKIATIKMHDVVRDVAIRIASTEHGFVVQAGLALKEWPRNTRLENCKAMSLMSNEIHVLPEVEGCPVLETLLLQGNQNLEEVSPDFFERMKALKVLDLSRVRIQLFPASFQHLTNLRTLCLDGCKITDISMVGELKMQETLSLRKSSIVALPNQLGELAKLRLLDLTLSSCRHIPPGVIPKLSQLEELYMRGSFAEWGHGHGVKDANGKENKASFQELLELPCLNILKVDVHDVQCIPEILEAEPIWERFDICVSHSQFTRSMCPPTSKYEAPRNLVLGTSVNTFPEWFKNVVSANTERLNFYECEDLQNIVAEYHQARLTNLKSLSINGCPSVTHLMRVADDDPKEPVLKSLEELHVHQMYVMKEICSGDLPQESLENLRFLEVKQCNELVNALLQPNLLQRIQKLEVLYVSGNSVEVVFGFEGLQLHGGGQVLQSLRELRLENLYKLTRIWKGPNQFAAFHSLKVITVIQCKELRNLLAPSSCQGLLKLEEIYVEECAELKEIIWNESNDLEKPIDEIVEENHEENAKRKLVLPQLKILSLKSLPKLTCFCSATSQLECPNLERLVVDGCPDFCTSVPEFHSNKSVKVIGQLNRK